MTAVTIERALSVFANAERATFMSGGYSPSRLNYVGASAPEMRSVVRTAHAAMKSRPAKDIIRLASVDGFSVYLAGVAWREGRIPAPSVNSSTRTVPAWRRTCSGKSRQSWRRA